MSIRPNSRPQFIGNIVGSVMNAYNNITWEAERLEYEEGQSPYGSTLLACLGIPSEPRKGKSHTIISSKV
jgi:hypothetical protein